MIENSLNVSLKSLLSYVNLCQGSVQTNRTFALCANRFFSFDFIISDIKLTFERSVFFWEKNAYTINSDPIQCLICDFERGFTRAEFD